MVAFEEKGSAAYSGKDDGIGSEALVRRGPSDLSTAQPEWTVDALESALLRAFPAEDAESWDRTGLVVGERACPVTKVAFALDPTVSAIREAADRGANVLVTHHPPFLAAPDSFAPENSVALSPGAGVYAAIRYGVALMCFHTALDVSPAAARVLPGMLGLSYTGKVVEPVRVGDDGVQKGYGQLSEASFDGEVPTLAKLAARATAVFGRQPRVWGDFERPVRRVVTATGSAGGTGRAALAAGADCLICGEVKYHEALDLSEAGLPIIELGHDVSELPLVALLAERALRAGLPEEKVVMIDQGSHWQLPEAIRL